MADDEAVPAVASTEDGSEVLEWVKVAARAGSASSLDRMAAAPGWRPSTVQAARSWAT